MDNALQELKIYEQKISPFNIPEDREYALSMKGCINNNKLDEARNLFQKRMVNLFNLQLGYITDRWEDTDKLREKLKDEYGL